jgi:translation elongation factor EF-1alpha
VVSKVDMESIYQQSSQYQTSQEKMSAIVDNLGAREREMGRTVSAKVTYATNIFWQVR